MSNDILPTLRKNDNPNYILNEIQARTFQPDKLEKTKTIYLPLLNIEIDESSLYIFTGGIVITYFIWKYLGLFSLFETNKFVAIIYIVQILLLISQIFTSSAVVATYTNESNYLESINQINSVILGSIILYAVFIRDANSFEYKIIYSSIIINSIFLLYVSIPKDPNNIRQIRKTKQVGLNIVIFLIIITVYFHMNPVKTQ